MSHGKEGNWFPTGGEQQPGASEKGKKKFNRTDYIINSRKTHTQKSYFLFPVGGASSQCKVWEGRSWWRRKEKKKRTNKNTHPLFSLSRYIGGSPWFSYIVCVLHSWGVVGWVLSSWRIHQRQYEHTRHTLGRCERHPLRTPRILFLLLFRVCYLLSLSLVLFHLSSTPTARSP